MPWARAADLSAASGGLTTLDQTIVKGSKLADGTLGSYYRLTFGAGEPHLPRTDLHPASYAPIHCAMSFVHFTDSHLVDAQSPGRVEFLDRYSEQQCGTLPFDAAFRPSTRRSGATGLPGTADAGHPAVRRQGRGTALVAERSATTTA